MSVQVFGGVAVDPATVRVVSKVQPAQGKERSSLLVGVKDGVDENLVLVRISEYAAGELLKHFEKVKAE